MSTRSPFRRPAPRRDEKLRDALVKALEHTTDGFIAIEANWRITYANAAVERMDGVKRSEVVGKKYLDAFPMVVGTAFDAELHRAMAARVPGRIESFFEPYARWFEMEVQPAEDGGLFFYRRDITARKQAEEELRRSEERLRHYFDLGLIGMAITSPTKGWLDVNDELCRILGYSREELLRKTWLEMTHPDDVAADIAFFNRVVAGELDAYAIEKRWIHKDGRLIDSEISVRCLRRSDGSVDYFVSLMKDVTVRNQALRKSEEHRQALLASEREARSAAERANRAKDEFLAILSHELRTPIGNVLLWAQLLASGKLDVANASAALTAIERSVTKQVRLIDDLLDVSRIASGKMRLEVAQVDVRNVLRAALDAAKPAAQAKDIALGEAIVGTDFRLSADANRLEQVFANLLTNAIKFTPQGGEVEVRLERAYTHIDVSVRDTGEGIDPEFLPYIFQRFRQADSSAARRHGGLGLGLAIVKELVELHGGTIRAESEGQGRGATFSVSLPLAEAVDTPAEKVSLSDDADLSGTRILVVDDDADTLAATAQMLSGWGAEIETAASADEALERLPAVRPRVLISDIGMPGKDGYELIREIRRSREYERLPAIALTAFTRNDDRSRALDAGYDKHVSKPVDTRELRSALVSLARRPP